MSNITIRHCAVAISLALTAFAAHAAYAADTPPATSTEQSAAKPVASATGSQMADKGHTGLTREQVREDLKRYQREHANPSYAELVFLR
ncbi:hypothetical protein G5S34_21895 [Herbaspirillum frisingense]|uniref:hypothetical protein n=1 Tax=Herbaspirillum frisingense TaxID=92645 RepID=UPI001603EDC0|nr:hypothetical protein [Herbaspirillum frisingense]QNB09139.1 hypothetical protein G5S34_21895 [Herbaspirillum frisingense]